MVDPFSGDFVYNIPLLDVEGYPINISYHSGVSMEQEASWVGLGWNINPGEINRTVRGLPDDFNGEKIEKELSIRPEKTFQIGLGASVSAELLGVDPKYFNVNLSASYGLFASFNNYKGAAVGMNIGLGAGVGTAAGVGANAGVNLAISSQGGADADLNAGVGMTISRQIAQDVGAGVGFNASGGTGFNSRTGLKNISFGFGVSAMLNPPGKGNTLIKNSQNESRKDSRFSASASMGCSVPIGLQNYVPVVTNASLFQSFQFQARIGGEVFYAYPNASINAMINTLEYEKDGSRRGYGYLYSENATDQDILDFSRDKDGTYNRTLPNLPLSAMTYDLYSVAGQGTGGMFRPFRNDIATVYDPVTKSTTDSKDIGLEFGFGNLFEAGADMNFYDNQVVSGPWKRLPFRGGKIGTLYEKAYFKQAGELTYSQQQESGVVSGDQPVYVREALNDLYGRGGGQLGSLPNRLDGTPIYGSNAGIMDRTSRANMLTYTTAAQATGPEIATSQDIPNWQNNTSGAYTHDPVRNRFTRVGSTDIDPKADHISEFTQTLADGRRYIYSIPAINHATREVTFSVAEARANLNTGSVAFTPGTDDAGTNPNGRERFYSSTTTPAYAHSYLLTAVLSSDYVDILGDGPTDDDLGSFVKFNYTCRNNDYRWKAPYDADSAQYNPGFWSDRQDGKGSYIVGSRQVWHLYSVETKNNIAEFFTAPRLDGKGTTSAVLSAGSKLAGANSLGLKSPLSAKGDSYKLDSIKLYNKHDLYIGNAGAVPLKTVIFSYDYSLCPGVPNTAQSGGGKLTLKRLSIRYGNSDKNLLSPYVFEYTNPNPAYSFADKDRWGNFKKNNPSLTNYEFPYSDQSNTQASNDAMASWNLSGIKLPSGGKINVKYEPDDYAFVQDRRTMQMVSIAGFGTSPAFEQRNVLYSNENNVCDYLYFQRRVADERPGLSLRDNYLEGQEMLYYSVNLDITGQGRYEHIKGYGRIEDVQPCPGNSTYGYIKLKRDAAGSMQLHPATILGINTGRYYIPHILYPGFKDGDGDQQVVQGLIAAVKELKNLFQNPFRQFIREGKAQKVRLDKSWVRLHVPGLSKKGGGIRVKELTLDDNWQSVSGSNASYGKRYEYTVQDPRYGVVSSGIASYEPLVGGDENPFRQPVKYTADAGRLLPAIDFFQEEPLGESFFPAPVVGYSRVTVKSIHYGVNRSAQAEEEHLFYTAKDFPLSVRATEKEAPPTIKKRTLRNSYVEEKALQGYVLRFNDMHGKPRAINNYVINTDGANSRKELVTSTRYNYQTNSQGQLDNTIKALVRTRGTKSTYDVQDVSLGREVDFTIDSRRRYSRSYNRTVAANVNAVYWGLFVLPIPTAFFPDKEDEQLFQMMVSTKVIQQYGLLKSVETYDRGATNVVENMIWDAETGEVLLSSVNNAYSDKTYNLQYPAHLAYQGMAPAYTNVGFEEYADSIKNFGDTTIVLYSQNFERYQAGDELLVSSKGLNSNNDTVSMVRKVWITDIALRPSLSCLASKPVPGTPGNGYNGCLYECHILLAPRFSGATGKYVGNQNFPWPGIGVSKKPYIKILRSGHRNQLNESVQEFTLAQNPYGGSVQSLFATNNYQILQTIAKTFEYGSMPYANSGYYNNGNQKDTLWNLTGAGNGANSTGAYAAAFSDVVSGFRWNYRPKAEYIFKGNRQYSANHSRYDGIQSAYFPFWYFMKEGSSGCNIPNSDEVSGGNLLSTINSFNVNQYWQTANHVTKYDVFGNAVERLAPSGIYNSAQFAFNKALVVSTAQNVRQFQFFFEGFEDHHILTPENLRNLRFQSAYLFTPFASLFNGALNLSASGYTNANNSTGNQTISRFGQLYNRLSAASGPAVSIGAFAHSGNFGLKVDQVLNVPLAYSQAKDYAEVDPPTDPRANQKFLLQEGRTYLFSCWVKAQAATPVAIPSILFGNTIAGSGGIKLTNSEGWKLIEYQVPANQLYAATQPAVSLNFPAGWYVDDIRMVPVDAAMKSYVYDAHSYRLVAQLDENHLTTFYEYDAEGQLIRTKKETDRGILTISENRRSQSKR